MREIIYEGPFKIHIKNHVELKQAIGYKYETEAGHLKRFDRFTLEKYSYSTDLTKEIVRDWCSKKTYEAQANQCSRASVIRQFGKYLDSIGVEAYIIPKGYYPAGAQYIPHIYTVGELTKFFEETDKCRYCYEHPYRHLIHENRANIKNQERQQTEDDKLAQIKVLNSQPNDQSPERTAGETNGRHPACRVL
jgi:integrase/recombinase XerD